MSRALFLLVLMGAVSSVLSVKILAAMPTIGRSHQFAFLPYLEALGKQGHQVTFLTFFPSQKPIANLTQIDVTAAFNLTGFISSVTIESIRSMVSPLVGMFFLSSFGNQVCEGVFAHPDVQKLIHSDEHFDLVITEMFNTDCFDAFAYKFEAPLIIMSASGVLPWVWDTHGNPSNPSYTTTITLGYTDRMSFYERFMNTVYYVHSKILYKLFGEMRQTSVARQYFGASLPSLPEITGKASLLLVNTHFSLQGARPLAPGTIEIGGIHIRPPKKLPVDIQKFLDDSKEGVVCFSMGSYIRSATFPPEKRKAFLDAFAEIPQRVLWKFEEDSLPGQPSNVKIVKWMPQNEILGHPNVKAFISHGGLLGTTEAVHNAVPMIGIPIMTDQIINIKHIESAGMGVLIDYENISKEAVLAALRAVLTIPSYQNNATRLSREFKDRPLPPLETALYWTDYVLRHHGAPQLQPSGANLTWYQCLLLDVVALIIGVLVVAILVIRRLWVMCCRRKSPVLSSNKKRN